ncbi:hypothetical protein OE810_10985 [Rhodobacteraceae bacterium XHP0102]|nr:hypothetical protein [Rhodobacteraceae bacterium XHP0102]
MLTLKQEDWKRYMTPEGLSEKAGVPQNRFLELIVKELIDNACDIGGGRMHPRDDNTLEFFDDGSGVPLEALSIKRPLISSKHWRLGERGALGNGLRVVMGALYCLGGHLEIHSHSKITKVLIGDDGETIYQELGETTETKVVVHCRRIGIHSALAKFKLTERMPGRVIKSDKAIPAWFDDEAIKDIQRSSEGLTLGDIVNQFRTNYHPTDPNVSFTLVDATEVLQRMQENTLQRTPSVQEVGSALMPEWEYASIKGSYGSVPYLIEAWVDARSPGSGEVQVVSLITNRAVSLTSVSVRIAEKGRVHITSAHDDYWRSASERDKYTLPKSVDYGAVLSISCPYFPIVSSGKAIDLHNFNDDLIKVLSIAGKKAQKAKRRSKSKKLTIKKAVEILLPEAYQRVSENGKYWANARQLMYAMRPDILRLCKIDSFSDTIVTQDYLPLFRQAGWKIAYDKRGALEEPHTGATVGLGTIEINDYQGRASKISLESFVPSQTIFSGMPAERRFNKLLWVEKEGFNQLIRESGLLERHDMAMASSKGLPVVAARELIDYLAGAVEGFQLYILADFDINGHVLADSLVNDRTRYQFKHDIQVKLLGVNWEQAQRLHSQGKSEPVSIKNKDLNKTVELLTSYGVESQAINFLLGRDSWDDQFSETPMRVELNAFTSRELLDLIENGVKGSKLIPKDLGDLYAEASIRKQVAAFEREVRQNAVPKPPYGLRSQLSQMLEDDPSLSWDEALAKLV